MDARILCLGALQFGDASGYEIKKMFEDGMLGYLHEASFGSIYPALTRLEQEGLATAISMAQDKRPAKKVYSITTAGREALVAALMVPPAPDKMRSDFLFMLLLGHMLPPSHLHKLVDRRIAWYRDSVAHMENCDLSARPPSVRLVNGLGLAVYRAAAEYLEANRHLVDDDRAAPSAMVAE
jgi:DNA-binding PadR family transcriptional regulator